MRKFKIFLFILLLVVLGIVWFISTGYYASGDRAGTISNFSEKGYVFKTWEGVLMEGGYSGETGTLSPRPWNFSAKDDAVVKKVREALASGERVTLLYQEKFIKFPWNGDTKFIVVDVQFLPKPERIQPQRILPTPVDTAETL
ncbi:hypothetical protein [Leadbetterella byssophila]|jgi:hypothetical protein|uniref:6-phosphogluconate dehydrogenase n=1 Tax=Leadbetterella byssophila (strain DSM 17132 / JCM 16389 / KACC 11308 / NBRC 106382 / 4M15) TaxID=649349 RepID=E4RY62_LEAB4|nr:hypothetical protein [Leadbetterella byssophila]ADQ17273.1 hypothetical protein Lbys_1565 [Leadbetterella byssophila DSM 17132]